MNQEVREGEGDVKRPHWERRKWIAQADYPPVTCLPPKSTTEVWADSGRPEPEKKSSGSYLYRQKAASTKAGTGEGKTKAGFKAERTRKDV